ncbi:hypothetical protein LTR06_004220 [Exophiala xenobiotica]|nr:hypothetical protein LTR06_004220 [Exophiala xenobiotica]
MAIPRFKLEENELLRRTAEEVTSLANIGILASQPLPDAVQKKIHNVQRRYTDQRRASSIRIHELRFPDYLTDTQTVRFRSQIFAVIKSRLQRAHVDIPNVPERFFAWMLPRDGARPADWNVLLNAPIFLPNYQLRRMINMVPSRTWEPPKEGTIIFYIRTYAFTLDEFLEVIQVMFDEGFGAQDTPYVLWELIRDLDPEDTCDSEQVIFIRYCGTTSFYSAWGRHIVDLKVKYATFKSTFFEVCQRLHPEIIEAVEVDELPDAAVIGSLHSQQQTVDLREQALIALLGPSTLLNTAKGGFSTKFVPQEVETTAISRLNTKLLQQLQGYNNGSDNTAAIHAYATSVQKYANSNAETTNTVKYPITDTVRDLISNAAMSAKVGQYTIMVTVGSDMTVEMISELKPWYKGGFESADVVIDIFNDLTRSELGYGATSSSFVRDMFEKHQLPFVDLFPWPAKDIKDQPKALEFLRDYLQIVNPLIALAFSSLVSGAAVGSFQHARGLKNTRNIDKLGLPIMSKFDHEVLDKRDENCIVVIPCMHPGHIRRSVSRGAVVTRLLHMTLAVAWLAMDVAIQLSRDAKSTKRQLCEHIREALLNKTGASTDFGRALQKLKDEYLETHATVNRMAKQTVNDKSKGKEKSSKKGRSQPVPQPMQEANSPPEAPTKRQTQRPVKGSPITGVAGASTQNASRRGPAKGKDKGQETKTTDAGTQNASRRGPAKDKNKRQDTKALDADLDDLVAPPPLSFGGPTLSVHGDIIVVQSKKLRWTRALEQLHIICACDVAEGPTRSPIRASQVERLLALSLGLLRGQNSGEDDEDVRKWMLEIPTNTIYYFAANTAAEIVTETPDVLTIFLPNNIDGNGDDWKEDPKLCENAISSVKTWIFENLQRIGDRFQESAKNLPRHFQALLQRKDPKLAKSLKLEIQQAPKPSELFEHNGQQVVILPPAHPLGRDVLSLKWEHDGELYELENFQVPAGCVPLTLDDPRFLFLTPEGIDIRDSSGRSMGTGVGRSITLPLPQLINSLLANPLQEEFLRLWQRMTGLQVDKVLSGGASGGPAAAPSASGGLGGSLPKSFFNGRQLALETTLNRTSKEKRLAALQQTMPFQPGDAGWLINKFIEFQYPHGGLMDLGNPSVFINSPSVWTHFASFLNLPCYYNHPHRANLEAACRMASGPPGPGGAGGGIVTNLIVMVQALRPPVTQRTAYQTIQGSKKTKTVLTIAQHGPLNAVIDREEVEEDLEDATLQQILGVDGRLVDVEPEDDDGFRDGAGDFEVAETARLAAERRQASQQVYETMTIGSAMPSLGRRAEQAGVGSSLGSTTSETPNIMPRANVEPATREEMIAAARQREDVLNRGYEGFNTATASASTSASQIPASGTKRSTVEEETKPAKRKRARQSRRHARKTGTASDTEDKNKGSGDEEMLLS